MIGFQQKIPQFYGPVPFFQQLPHKQIQIPHRVIPDAFLEIDHSHLFLVIPIPLRHKDVVMLIIAVADNA